VGPPGGAVLLPRAGSGQRHNWPRARHNESGPVGGVRERKMGRGCGIRPKRKKGFLCFFSDFKSNTSLNFKLVLLDAHIKVPICRNIFFYSCMYFFILKIVSRI
jgi:hypothetical protein